MSVTVRATHQSKDPSLANTVGVSLATRLKKWRMNHRGRKQLATLPDFLLKDLGICRSQIEQESQKPFWKN
ncbi:MAG: DUF1127 domain-containing protein [Marinobacter sp.]